MANPEDLNTRLGAIAQWLQREDEEVLYPSADLPNRPLRQVMMSTPENQASECQWVQEFLAWNPDATPMLRERAWAQRSPLTRPRHPPRDTATLLPLPHGLASLAYTPIGYYGRTYAEAHEMACCPAPLAHRLAAAGFDPERAYAVEHRAWETLYTQLFVA